MMTFMSYRLVVVISLTICITKSDDRARLRSTPDVSAESKINNDSDNEKNNNNNDDDNDNTLYFRSAERLVHTSKVKPDDPDGATEKSTLEPRPKRLKWREDPFRAVPWERLGDQFQAERNELEDSIPADWNDSLQASPEGLKNSLPKDQQGLETSQSVDLHGPDFTNGQRSSLFGVPWWPFFLTKVAYAFRGQRRDKKSQFGVAYMARVDKLQNFNPEFLPHNKDGSPYINNKEKTSPVYNNMTNFVASKAEDVSGSMLDAIDLILKDLQSLDENYNDRLPDQPANLILLYWWIMPSPDSIDLILCHLNHSRFANFKYKVLVYTEPGISTFRYMTKRNNRKSCKALRAADIHVFRQTCDPRDKTDSTSHDFSQHGIDSEGTSPLSSSAHLPLTLDMQVCKLEDTLQGCMVECLGSNICCSCKASGRKSMTAAVVNQIAKHCATREIQSCAVEWVKTNVAHTPVSACTSSIEIESEFKTCAAKCSGRPLSKPLDPKSPSTFPGCLTDFSDLANPPEVDLTEFCEDMRTGGYLCTTLRSDSFTAGNTLCRSDNRCDFRHHGLNRTFSWCYIDWRGNFGSCCIDKCSFRGENSRWCMTGTELQHCGDAGQVTVDGRRCLAEFPCGLHPEIGNTNFYWCYTDIALSWGRCCQPGQHCDESGHCYTGRLNNTEHNECHKDVE